MLENTADNQTCFGINLQLFAEGEEAAPATETAPAAPVVTDQPAATAPDPRGTQSLTDFLSSRMAGNQETAPVAPVDGGAPTLEVKPDVTPKAPEPLPDVPDKFKNPDGTVNTAALAKSYVNMEAMYSKQAPQVQQINELQQTVIALQTQIAQQAQAANTQTQQVSPEELEAQIEAENEKFWEEYNKNPKQAIAKLVKDAIQPVVEPIQQREVHQQEVAKWHEQVNKFAETHEDFEATLPEMRKVVAEYGDVLTSRPDAVEAAYNLAKARQAIVQPAPVQPQTPPTVDELLKDQDFIAKLTRHPQVKNLVVQQHMQDIKNNPAPPVIGTKPGGLQPSTEALDLKDPKTAKEALKAKYAGFTFS
ncbi:MAG: hypothetical protein M0P69_21215 [Bacteroidales bacterium]|nr:hypothetical protein [Bacteroidales bacterium]